MRTAVVIGALLLYAAIEWTAWFRPHWFPYPFDMLAGQMGLGRRLAMPDWSLGMILRAPLEYRYRWRGHEARFAHAPFPDAPGSGWRAPTSTATPKAVDILVVGDSFAYGFGVDYHSTFVDRLRVLTGRSTATLGVGGYGTLQQAERLRRHGAKFKPKTILLLMVPNDPMDDLFFHKWTVERQKPDTPWLNIGEIILCGSLGLSPVPCAPFRLMALAGFLPRLGIVLTGTALHRARHEPRAVELLKQGVDELQTESKRLRARLIVVLTVGWVRMPRERAALLEHLAARKLPVLELKEKLETVPLDGHWVPESHAKAAEAMAAFLK